jgi:hypothetical protein
MIATARQELKTQIKTAFGSVPFPSHQGLRGSMARDDYATDEEAQSITTDQDILGEWWQIPKDELRSCTLGLSYLDAVGVLFYLPAYLDMALDDVGKKRLWVLQLLNTGIGDDDEPGLRAYKEGQLRQLNHAQRKACIHTLQFLRLQLTDDPLREHEHERAQIENILNDPYWRAIETD